jgi:NAD-dependent SIR2 family protein deacetylase
MDEIDRAIEQAAAAIAGASSLVITAGAGMGVDSGLPDFRGDEGFWRAYPPFRKLGLSFAELADPRWFDTDPALAWGFYGHRLHLYRGTRPHDGFAVLERLARRAPGGAFVFTSNVDGQFQTANFPSDRIVECHGSIHFLQCAERCHGRIWPADGVCVDVDPTTFRASRPWPSCPRCGGVARPNVLMFGDGNFLDERTELQYRRLEAWLSSPRGPTVVIELGAGTAVPSVRNFGERLARRGARLCRINVREPDVPPGHIGIALGAREAMARIERRIEGLTAV